MARPSKWNSPTELVRLPAHLIPRLVEIAKILDHPTPETQSDPLFEEYARFVQNLKPALVSVMDSKGESQYLIEPGLITFEEFKEVKQVEANVYAEMDKLGLTQQERVYIFSLLVQEWGQPVRGANRG